MGRAALDEDAIRSIEEHNPDIEFDWTRILKGGGEPQPERRGEPRPPRESREPEPAEEPVVAESPPVPVEEPQTAAGVRLGAEGLARLRGRYAEMLARISERVQDPQKQEELKSLAERLNPDAWVTDEEVATGLDGYEATFESLRGVVGHRRRRRRRRPTDASREKPSE